MTVSELIQQLQTLPPDALVVTEGYETGYEPIKKVQMLPVEENNSHNWWDGKYEKSEIPGALQVVFLNAKTKDSNK
jgi:hypothetical protein